MCAEPLSVSAVTCRRQLKEFIRLPWSIYAADRLWVPPLMRDVKDMLTGSNALFEAGPHTLLLASRGGRTVGRICAGVNWKLNEAKGRNEGYVSLFESVNDEQVSTALFDRAAEYLRRLGVDAVIGPVSPTNGDEFRGLLIGGPDCRPVLFQSYNPAYYPGLFERYGFAGHFDYYAYRTALTGVRDRGRAVRAAAERYGYRTEPLDMSRLDDELQDIRQIMEQSMPHHWIDLTPPTIEELRQMGRRLRGLAVPELVRIARCGDRPIGCSVAIPDYNQALLPMNGSLFPVGWARFLLARRSIDTVVLFVMFVVPDFQRRGVPYALHYDTWQAARARGYEWGEGSTILDTNTAMRREAVNLGAVHHKTYRVYRKELRQDCALTAG